MGAAASPYEYELLSPECWPGSGRARTADDLVADLRRLLDCEAVLGSFAIVFAEPVPAEVRQLVTDAVRASIVHRYDADDTSVDWIDDLVDETGWEGVRATIDGSLAPRFSGHPDDGDRRHSGVWADERTFVHIELESFRWTRADRTDWIRPWVGLRHWHPSSMTSGSWSDDLILLGPSEQAGVLLRLSAKDEDGLYWEIAPRPADPADAARAVEGFFARTFLFGAEAHLLTLHAHGFPCDGSAAEFTVGMLPGTENPGYEISSLVISPPGEVVAELVARATLDPGRARTLRDAIVTAARTRWEGSTLDDLSEEWAELVARLDTVVGP